MTARATVAPAAAAPEAERARARSPVATVADPRRRLDRVPTPLPDETTVALGGVEAGGLEAVMAEWGANGGAVVLTGRRPFLDLTARASFRPDGSLDGAVDVRAQIGLFGMPLGEARWSVAGWEPSTPLAAPLVAMRGTSIAVDLTPLPPEAVLTTASALAASRDGAIATIDLPSDALPDGQPLSPRMAELFRGLLGVDVGDLTVHPDAPGQDAPGFVSNADLFFAPGIYGVDSPETLAVLDAAVRAALAGLTGPVGGAGPAAPAPQPPAPEGAGTSAPSVVPESGGSPPPTPAAAEAPAAAAAVGADIPAAGAGGGAAGAATAGSAASEAGAPATDAAAGGGAAGVAEVLMPEAPTVPTPAAAARGGAVAGGAGGAAAAATNLPNAEETTADAHAAVTEPAAETAARAREELASELGERPAPSPEIVALAERIRIAIRENRPEGEDALLRSDPTTQASQAGATITGTVEGQVTDASGAYDGMSSPPAGSPALTPTPVVTPDASSPGMGVDAASAAPDPLPAADTSLAGDVAATDQRIADSGMETRVTAEIPDGPFAQARAARGELGELAARTPEEIHAEEQTAIDSAQADMAQLQLQALASMRAARGGTVGDVATGQGSATTGEEGTRRTVSEQAQTLYDDAERRVGELLTPLSRTAIARWDAGLARLSRQFHDALNRVQRWIDERHSGVFGSIVAIGDYVAGLPDWVTDEYNRAEREFGDGVTDLLLDISSDVNGVLEAARAIVQTTRTQINGLFDQMEAEFPEEAARERARFAGLLDGLNSRVNDAETSFVRDVSSRAIAAVNEAHAAVEAKRQEAGGLIGQVIAAINEFIEDPVRAIINGLLRLVGIPPGAFWALLAQIEQVAGDIAADPENFINNLVAGVKAGFQQFFDHFGMNLIRSFWQWLFSGMESPIPMPTSYDPLSLMQFALSLMGITWPNIREILVRHIGPTAVDVLEAAWNLLSILIQQGPQGIVDLIKEQLSPENIVGMILDAAIEYLVQTLIVQAAQYIFSLLNPAGAVAQAIRLIYTVCAWIFRNAARIFSFVQAVVGGIANVVAGNISGMAGVVERALVQMMVVAIDFLAGLLGLGGLPDEVAAVIVRMQTYVLGIVERIVVFFVTRARTLLARLGIGGDNPDDPHHNNDDELGSTVRFSAAHEGHRTWIDRRGADAEIMVASTPVAIRNKIGEWRGKLADTEDRDAAEAKLNQLETMVNSMDTDADVLAREFEEANRDPRDDKEPPSDDSLEGRQRSLATLLREVFELFEKKSPEEYLADIATHLPTHGSSYAEVIKGQWERTITGPKVAPDGTTPLWDMTVVSTTGALQYARSGSTHQQLLPYFLVGSQRSGGERTAGTDAFRNFAFETDSPDPAHTVRTGFLRSLGTDTVTRMERAATRTVTTQDNAELLRQIHGMTFTSTGSRWGAFIGIPGDSVNPLLRTAIQRAGGIIEFLKRMVSPGSSDGVSFAQFLTVWNASSETKNYVKGLFRAVNAASHEWIPTNYIPQVIETAVDAANAGNLRDGMRWVTAHNTLRSPTQRVLHRPVVTNRRAARRERTDQGPTVDVELSGHVGAFREDRDGTLVTTGTVGTEDFHDWLRAEFSSSNSLGPVGYIQHLQSQLPTRVWDGDNSMFPDPVLSQPVGMLYRCEDGVDRALTVGQLALRQRLNWQRIQDNFAAARAATEAAP